MNDQENNQEDVGNLNKRKKRRGRKNKKNSGGVERYEIGAGNYQNIDDQERSEENNNSSKTPKHKLSISNSFRLLTKSGRKFLHIEKNIPKIVKKNVDSSAVAVTEMNTCGVQNDNQILNYQHSPKAKNEDKSEISSLDSSTSGSFEILEVAKEEKESTDVAATSHVEKSISNNLISQQEEYIKKEEIMFRPLSIAPCEKYVKSGYNLDTKETVASEKDCESLSIKDHSKVVEVEFDNLYTQSVPRFDTMKSNTDESNVVCCENRIPANCDSKYSPEKSSSTRDKVIETHFNSLYTESINENHLNISNLADSLLLDNSNVCTKLKSDDLQVVNPNKCLKSDDQIIPINLNHSPDFNNDEISFCSTLNESSDDNSNIEELSAGSTDTCEVKQNKDSSIPSLLNQEKIHQDNKTSIENSPTTVVLIKPFDSPNEYCQTSRDDQKYNHTDRIPLVSITEKSIGTVSSMNNYKVSTTNSPILAQSMIITPPRALEPERFLLFGSPINRLRLNSAVEGQNDVSSKEKKLSIDQDLCGFYNNLAPTLTPEMVRNKHKKISNKNYKRSKKLHNVLHTKYLRNLSTIAEDTVGVGPDAGTSEHLFKILVIGNLSTGKTSIIRRYVNQYFSDHYRATVGVDFALKVLHWDADTTIRLQLWDIAGQERYAGGMTRVYYKEAVGAFVVFDVTDNHSLDAAVRWKKDLDDKVTLQNGRPIPSVLLANKCDKLKAPNMSSKRRMEEVCKEAGFNSYFETSAKENINIEEAVTHLVNKILKLEKDGNFSSESYDSDKISVVPQRIKIYDTKKSCIC